MDITGLSESGRYWSKDKCLMTKVDSSNRNFKGSGRKIKVFCLTLNGVAERFGH